MQEENFDILVIYADLEHGSNFEYSVGFLPRFEEDFLVMHQDGCNYMLMGNENLNKVEHARINAEAIMFRISHSLISRWITKRALVNF